MMNNPVVIPKDPKPGLPIVLDIILMFLPPIGTAIGVFCLVKRLKASVTRQDYARYRRYAPFLSERSAVSVQELASRTGQSEAQVIRDIQTMIDKGFLQNNAVLDRSVDMVVFRSNPFTESNRAPVQAEPLRAKAQPEARMPSADDRFDEFEKKLREIQMANDAISSPVVSRKIDTIKALSAGIFSVARNTPDREPEVRKFMNYYLPTTLKLLTSYSQMEHQPYRSESIVASMKKIEDILDTLIVAFDRMHAKLFKSEAMDLDAEISVLETMMAGDGLSSKGNIRAQASH